MFGRGGRPPFAEMAPSVRDGIPPGAEGIVWYRRRRAEAMFTLLGPCERRVPWDDGRRGPGMG